MLVIVDTLSFSTAVAAAVHHGGLVCPCPEGEDPVKLARRIGGEAAVRRAEVPKKGRFSLSPLTYVGRPAGTRIILSSPNGATGSHLSQHVPYLFAGALVNAKAVAVAISQLLDRTGLPVSVTVIACGEREASPSEDGQLRWAVEDYLGAGAILSYLGCEKSPEARICEGAFIHSEDKIEDVLSECESGRELRDMGYGKDVAFAAQLNIYDTVPILRDGFFDELRPV